MNLVRRMMLRASSRIEQVSRALRYAAVGSMRLDDMRSELDRYWNAYAADVAEEDTGLRPWEVDVVSRFVRAGDSVLVVGCGTGRDVFPLVEMGCLVTGVEPVADAATAARRALATRHMTAEILCGYIEDVALGGPYDVIKFSDFCYSLIPESRRRVEVLRKAVRHLAAGGHVVITAFITRTHHDARARRIARGLGRACGSDWRLEAGDHVASISTSGALVWSFSHEFTLDELGAETSEAGLTIVYRHPHVPAFVLTAQPPSP